MDKNTRLDSSIWTLRYHLDHIEFRETVTEQGQHVTKWSVPTLGIEVKILEECDTFTVLWLATLHIMLKMKKESKTK